MKNTLYKLLAAAGTLVLAVACHKPEYVLPTADRDGFTSLSAYFTSGEYNNMLLARLEVTDEMIREGRLVVPVPYYYPEESDKSTTKYMSSLRMKAELDKNCSLSPALTILDLELENKFTYTDAQGEKWDIVITGERTKSSDATFISFSLVDMFEAFVSNEERKIYLYTTDDLSSCTAEAEVSAHASIVTDLSRPRDYNEPQTIVIKAHSGKEISYVTEKATPTKIRSGFNAESVKQLFNFDPKSRYGTPDYLSATVNPSLAVCGGYLVVCLGDGSTPFYVHGTTGVKMGEIALGSAEAGGITSDNVGNMLVSNSLEGKGTLKIWKTSSVTAAPELFYEYDNEVALPVGVRLKVNGDIGGDAVITLPYGGVARITESSSFLMITVKGGSVTEAKVIDLAGAGLSWSEFSARSAGFAPASTDPAGGVFTASYGTNRIDWLDSSLAISKSMGTTDGNAWAWNTNVLDCRTFNNVDYLIMLSLAHFPVWGGHPTLYVYNVTNKTSLIGEFTSSPALVMSMDPESFNGVNADDTVSSGDAVIASSADGFKIFFYYYDQYAGAIGGYSADCIKR